MKISEIFQDRVVTLPNFFTILRILILPAVLYSIYLENTLKEISYKYYTLAGIIAIVLTDFLDGFLARRLNQISRLGKFLDPIVDKIAVISIVFFLVLYKGFPVWVLLFSMAREIYVVYASYHLYTKKDIEVQPNVFGKICVPAFAFSIIIYTLSVDMEIVFISIKQISVTLVIIFYILGGILYAGKYAGAFFEKSSS